MSIKLDASNETPQGTPEVDASISMLTAWYRDFVDTKHRFRTECRIEGRTTEFKPELKTEVATCFVALENNAYSKFRYLSLMIHNAYLE